MNIPKVATHTIEGRYYRKTLGEWLVFTDNGWCSSYVHPAHLSDIAKPILEGTETREDKVKEMVERFALHNADNVDWKALFEQMYDCGVFK